jgi:TRAP-type C4-dicarboxylate transport system permease small subunit
MISFSKGVARLIEVFITLLFFVMTVLVILLVILRYFFKTTIIGGQEFVTFCFIYTTAVGAGLALFKGEQIAVRFFLEKLPLKAKTWVERLDFCLIALLNAFLVILSIPWIHGVGYFESPVLRIPQGVVLVSLPVGCGLVSLFAILLMFVNPYKGLEGSHPNP